MLVTDLKKIGNRLYEIRTKKLMSRAEVAEMANLSDRTYADIERGSVNMRIETVLKICAALDITPDDIFVAEDPVTVTEKDIAEALQGRSNTEKETAMKLLEVYVTSLE